jgi:uncharacterized protein (TIGR04255 family)
VRNEDEYPRYDTVIRLFEQRLETFEAFLAEHGIGKIDPRQYELTYINHVPKGDGWSTLGHAGKVFRDFVRDGGGRFLPEPESINWKSTFNLPDTTGRLHATIRDAIKADERTPILQLEMTARGIPSSTARDAMRTWFDMAHEWIVRGFADLTAETVRRDVWRQIR